MAHYVAVTGGRGFTDIESVREALRILQGFHGDELRVIHGAAPGADSLAAAVADELGIPARAYPAKWQAPCDPDFCEPNHRRERSSGKDYCPAAGVRRNAEMVAYLDHWRDLEHSVALLAFMGGRGTADMIERCEAALIPVSHG